MPDLEKTGRHQYAVLWAASGTDDQGCATLAAAEEIKVRWTEGSAESGNPLSLAESAPVTAVVDRDVAVGSILWLGRLADLPASPTNLKSVTSFNKVPCIKGRKFYRTVSLVKHSDTLPTLA